MKLEFLATAGLLAAVAAQDTSTGDREDDLPAGQTAASEEDTDREFAISAGQDPVIQSVLNTLAQMDGATKDNRTRALGAMGPMGGNGGSDDEMYNTLTSLEGNYNELEDSLKRFVDLKRLVAWLQPVDKRISRYCYYGCWCLPEGAHGFVSGTGRPVDNVDKACMYLWWCYTCAREDFGACNPVTRKYARLLTWNNAQPNNYDDRDIRCTNNWRRYNRYSKYNCARAICECDRGFSVRLNKHWDEWSKRRHRIWSEVYGADKFTVEKDCVWPGSPNSNGPDHDFVACGSYEDDGARFPHRTHAGLKACCNMPVALGLPWNGLMYSTVTEQCCDDGTIIALGDVCAAGGTDIDQCSTGVHDCQGITGPADAVAACINIDDAQPNGPGYYCVCNSPFFGLMPDINLKGIRHICRNINECNPGNETHDCQGLGNYCIDEEPGWSCDCDPGFELDGVSFTSVPGLGHQNTCQDRDECLDGSNDCTGVNIDAHECNNAVGTFSCACNAGYQFTSAISVHPQNTGNGFDCEDVDECSTTVDECSDNTECNNAIGTYECDCVANSSPFNVASDPLNTAAFSDCACLPGFENAVPNVCSDVQECDDNVDECGDNTDCTNAFGTYECSCVANASQSSAQTDPLNTGAMNACACDAGYENSTPGNNVCTDIHECNDGTDECGDNTECTNDIATYECTCVTNASLSIANSDPLNTGSVSECLCDAGYENSTPGNNVCTDIHECNDGTDECGANTACTNDVATYECSCVANASQDAASSDVLNTGSMSTCACDAGYENAVPNLCSDIQECNDNTDECGDNTACSNDIGTYECSCVANASQSIAASDPLNTGAMSECLCDAGYENATPGNNVCSDADECGDDTDECGVLMVCANGTGDYSCSCITNSSPSAAAVDPLNTGVGSECACDGGFFHDTNFDTCEELCTTAFSTGVEACNGCEGGNDQGLCASCTDPNAEVLNTKLGCQCQDTHFDVAGVCEPTCVTTFNSGVEQCASCQADADQDKCATCVVTNSVVAAGGLGCECDTDYFDNGGVCDEICTVEHDSGVIGCSSCDPSDQDSCTGCITANAVPKGDGDGCECDTDFFEQLGACAEVCTSFYDTGVEACSICQGGADDDLCGGCIDGNAVPKAGGDGCECDTGFTDDGGVCTENCTLLYTGVEACTFCDNVNADECTVCADPNAELKVDALGCVCSAGFNDVGGVCT